MGEISIDALNRATDEIARLRAELEQARARIAELEADLVTPKYYTDGWCAALDRAAAKAWNMHGKSGHDIAAAIRKLKEYE